MLLKLQLHIQECNLWNIMFIANNNESMELPLTMLFRADCVGKLTIMSTITIIMQNKIILCVTIKQQNANKLIDSLLKMVYHKLTEILKNLKKLYFR